MSSTLHAANLHTHEVEVKSIRLGLVFTECLWQENESSKKKASWRYFNVQQKKVVPDHTLVW